LDDIKDENRFQLIQLFGKEAFCDTLEEAVQSYRYREKSDPQS